MRVPLRRRDLGSLTRDRARAWRDDDSSTGMARRDLGIDVVPVIGAIPVKDATEPSTCSSKGLTWQPEDGADQALGLAQRHAEHGTERRSRTGIPPLLDQDVEHHSVLVHRPPEIMQLAVDPQVHFTKVPGVPWLRPTPAPLPSKLGTNLRHHWRILSWVTVMSRSARISSTSRRLRLNRWQSQTACLMISAGKR
jgi:hypothetical protein